MYKFFGPDGFISEVATRADAVKWLKGQYPDIHISVEGGPVRYKDGRIDDPREKIITNKGRFILWPIDDFKLWNPAVLQSMGWLDDSQPWNWKGGPRALGPSAQAEALADVQESERRQDAGLEEAPL